MRPFADFAAGESQPPLRCAGWGTPVTSPVRADCSRIGEACGAGGLDAPCETGAAEHAAHATSVTVNSERGRAVRAAMMLLVTLERRRRVECESIRSIDTVGDGVDER